MVYTMLDYARLVQTTDRINKSYYGYTLHCDLSLMIPN